MATQTDVIICGGGPVGLLIGYGLRRMNIRTIVIERDVKRSMPMYGRASTLYPRTCELLDQYELLDTMVQVGLIGKGSVTYKDGKRVTSRGWHHIFNHLGETFLDYILNIRMKYSEDIFRQAYEDLGGILMEGWELIEMNQKDGIEVVVKSSEKAETLKGQYIIGADGGRSTVRKLAGIQMEGESSPYRWVRIDGDVETNMPDKDIGFAAIESPTHGNVLWVTLDHDKNRIGFALNSKMLEKYGENMTQDQVVEEAKNSMKPFSVEFKSVDWYTTYSVRQSLAEKFIKGHIILAGDAGHLHSSGAAQGMNTGVHDAINLTWKLAGVIKGWYKDEVLQSYEDERRPIARHLLDLDKRFSILISGKLPENETGDPNELITRLFDESMLFNIGLGIHYDENILNLDSKAGMITSGHRTPDVLIRRPGSSIPIRLQQVTKNVGIFWVVVFAGDLHLTKQRLKGLRSIIDEANLPEVKFLTIINGNKLQGEIAMGVKRFGDIYYDWDCSAHYKYGYSPTNGGISIIRPDGLLGFATTLEDGKDIEEYFSRFFITK